MKKQCIFLIGFVLILAGCGQNQHVEDTSNHDESTKDELTPVSFVLDWTPNTNHTGIYVAKEKGFFEEEGLDVDIKLPGQVDANQLIATGKADFGISVQENMTIARDEGLSIVSVAAIIQHNTAGYASPVEKNINKPADFEGKTFGSVGSELERAMMQTIMEGNGGDPSTIDFKNIGDSDYFTAVQRDIDFALVYQAWTGIEAEIRGLDLNMIYLRDYSEELDFYTPLIATSEKIINENPETVRAFVHAAAKGYEYAIDHPEDAAEVLIDSVPDLDPNLVKRSQEWLSDKYQDDAEQFGIQEEKRWESMKNFMLDNDLIEQDLDINQAFTNDFLPNE